MPRSSCYILRAKKSFGQHFLNSERIARRIAQSLILTGAYRRVVEVGPGKGMLTQFLLERDFDLLVVEADRDMVDYLELHFPALHGRIIEGDFLQVPLEQYLGREPFGLIGNFPYNISSQILFRMLEYRQQVPEMAGMFQKEMAERIVAGPGSKTYGVISVLVQAYYEASYLFGVDRSKFSPPPQVQSAVIRLVRRDSAELGCDEALFRQIVKQAFSQRRKMLRNTMKQLIPGDPMLEEAFFQQRPEQLSVRDFVDLTNRLKDRIITN